MGSPRGIRQTQRPTGPRRLPRHRTRRSRHSPGRPCQTHRPPAKSEPALAVGCGTGPLAQALAQYYDNVVGIDISPPILDTVRRLDRSDGRRNFVHNNKADLAPAPTARIDLLFTGIVLQAIPPDLTLDYFREFGRVIRPGGAVCVLMPTSTKLTPQGLLFQHAPQRVVRELQVRLLPYPAPMRTHTLAAHRLPALLVEAGLSIVGTSDERQRRTHWTFIRFFAVKPHPEQ